MSIIRCSNNNGEKQKYTILGNNSRNGDMAIQIYVVKYKRFNVRVYNIVNSSSDTRVAKKILMEQSFLFISPKAH